MQLGKYLKVAARAALLSGFVMASAMAQEKPLRVGFFITGNSNAYQQAEVEAAEETAKDLGLELTILYSNFDVQEQNNQIELALQRDLFDAMVFTLNSGDQQCNIVKKAVEEVLVALVVTTACGGIPDGVVTLVNVQTKETFERWWDMILSSNEPGEVALFTGPPLVDLSKIAVDAFNDVSKTYPGFKLAAVLNTDYTVGNAYEMASDTLRANPNLKIIASNYSGMTQGVLQAAKQLNKVGEVKIYDLLADQNIVNQIEEGNVTASLPGLPRAEVRIALESLVAASKGETVEKLINPLDSLELEGGPFVTKDNAAQFTAEF